MNLDYACQAVFMSVLSGFHGRTRAHRGSGRKGQTRGSRLYRSWWNPVVREPGVDPGTSFRSHAVHLRSQRSLVRAPPLVFYLDAYPSIIPNKKKVLCTVRTRPTVRFRCRNVLLQGSCSMPSRPFIELTNIGSAGMVAPLAVPGTWSPTFV